MNPELGKALKLLHRWIAYMNRSRAQMDMLDDVHVELGREKWPAILSQIVTCWSSRFRETHGSSVNQYDFELAFKK